MKTTTFAAGTKISAATFMETRDRAGKVAFVAMFNNCIIVAKDWKKNALTIHATDFAAQGIARIGGFKVVKVGTVPGGEAYEGIFEVDFARASIVVEG